MPRPLPYIKDEYKTIHESFLQYLLLNGMTSDYYQSIRLYLSYCSEKNIDIFNIDYEIINMYLLDNKSRNISNARMNVIMNALRKFYYYLATSRNLDPHLLEVVKKFKQLKPEKKLRNVVSEEEFKQMLSDTITFCHKFEYDKYKAILYFMFYTGLRISELINLKRVDIDLIKNQALIRIPNKAKQERYVFFTQTVSILLKKYFSLEREKTNAFNITKRQLRFFLEKFSKFLVGKKFTAHSFRHSFCNMLAENEISVRVAQKLMGHKSMNSTLIYYDPDIKLVEKIYRKNIDKEIK